MPETLNIHHGIALGAKAMDTFQPYYNHLRLLQRLVEKVAADPDLADTDCKKVLAVLTAKSALLGKERWEHLGNTYAKVAALVDPSLPAVPTPEVMDAVWASVKESFDAMEPMRDEEGENLLAEVKEVADPSGLQELLDVLADIIGE